MTTDIWYVWASHLQTTLFAFLCILFFKYIIHRFRRDPRLVKFASTLPGPFDFPLIGNGLEFLVYGIDDFDEIFSTFHKKYGSVYRMWMGKQLVVGLSELEHVEAVFRSTKTLAKPRIFEGFHELFENSIFTAPLHVWRKTRKHVQPIFTKHVIKFQIPTMNKAVEKYVNLMKNEIDGPEFDLNKYMPYLAADSFIHTYFDLDLTKEQNQHFRFHEIADNAGQNGVKYILIPWFRIKLIRWLYFGSSITSSLARLQEFIGMIKDTQMTKAEEHVDEKEMKNETLAKSLFPTVKQLQDEMKVDRYMFDELGVMILAATDTTSITISFFLLSIAMYPEIQEKLFDELSNVFDVSDDRPATINDLSRLPYLDQVIKETQRRYTLIPVIFRGVEADMKIGTMNVPSGTTLMIRIGDIHFNPDLYPNPLEFNPENFSMEAVSRRSKYSWLPFSAGTRDCIGKIYAEIAMKLMLISFLRNFKFSTTTKIEDINYKLSFIIRKRGGYQVSITSRK